MALLTNQSKYHQISLIAICLMACCTLQLNAQDSSAKIIDLNQNKLVKKINSILDSTQNKIKGAIYNKANELNKSASNEINKTLEQFTNSLDERPLPYERLLYKKYTLGRRAYQNTVAQFNYYFNADEELNEIVLKARLQNQDDYSNLLGFYDYDLNNISKTSIDSIIYRCNANILLHDQRNNWIDDSYLLLAKAYLYHKNFDTAGNVLQFINANFDEKVDGMNAPIGSNTRQNGKFSIANKEDNRMWENVNVRNESLIWLARNYFETNEINEGLSILQMLKSDGSFPKRLQAFLHEQLAYGNYLSESYENAATNLIEALPNAPDMNAKSRWHFLIAQLWYKTNNIEQSYKWFRKASENSSNPIIAVYAKINMTRIEAKNYNQSWELLANNLERITRKEKFKPFADIIYFEMAKLAIENKAIDKASNWLISAIKKNNTNPTQKQLAFELLGDINYQADQYYISKISYDSITNVLKTNPQFEKITLRKKWMSTILDETKSYQREDSLQYIYTLPVAEQISYAKKWDKNQINKERNITASLNEPAINLKNTAVMEQQTVTPLNNSDYYFSNKYTVTQGKQSFIQKWGERPNVDLWRRKTSAPVMNSNAMRSTMNQSNVLMDSNIVNSKKGGSKDTATYSLIQNDADLKKSNIQWNNSALKAAQVFLLELNDFSKAKPIYKKIIEKAIDPEITERAMLDLASQYLHDGFYQISDSIIKTVVAQFPNGAYLKNKKAFEKKNTQDQDIITKYKEAYFLSQIGNWNQLEKLSNEINSDIRKTKWNIPLQFLKVKMYAQQKQDNKAIVILDSIIYLSKNDRIREKAKNIINELKNRKTTEDYLTSLQLPSSFFETYPVLDTTTIAEAKTLPTILTLDTVKTPKQTQDSAKSIVIQPTPIVELPKELFSNDSLEAHYVGFVTNKVNPVLIKEMQNALQNVNREEYYALNLNTTYAQFDQGNYIIWVGPFEDRKVAKIYFSRLSPKLPTEIISFVPTNQYETYIIGKTNIILIKDRQDLLNYKNFMLNKIYKP